MSKILCIGDTHNGANGNNPRLLQQNVELYERIRKIIYAHNIDFCVDLGDFFDDREKIDVKTLGVVRNKMLKDLPVPFYFIVGNHNLYYKNSSLVNNLTETIGDLPNVHIIDKYTQIPEASLDLIPWINNANAEYISELIKGSTSKWCMGHFEFNGFQFDKSRVAEVKEKISASLFHNYIEVISGHYHIASHKGNITYLGTPVQLTWIDVDVEKKLLILDTDTGEHLELADPNPLYVQFTINTIDDFKGTKKEDICGRRVKVHYHVDIPKEDINNLQTILKSWEPDQLTFIPFGQKKVAERLQVQITNGLETALREYIMAMPSDNEKVKSVIEKIVLSYYNKSNNKE